MSGLTYRLGLDLGTDSIGWAILKLEEKSTPCEVIRLGSRIFNNGREPKTGASLAVARREARLARRRRDRILQRKDKIVRYLIRKELLPPDEASRQALKKLNPYQLRARAAEQPLQPYELGRVLIHLSQRCGFKSNRKTAPDKESSSAEKKRDLKMEQQNLQNLIAESGSKTLGQYLWKRLEQGQIARAKPEAGIYPNRAMYEHEFSLIQETQAPHCTQLSSQDWQQIRKIIYYQRPLKPPIAGRCTFEKAEPRALLALPTIQKLITLQNVRNLSIFKGRDLTDEERKVIFKLTQTQKEVKFDSIRSKVASLADAAKFNLESERRNKIPSNETAYLLRKKEHFGAKWDSLTDEQQDEIVRYLLLDEDSEDPEHVKAKALTEWGLTEVQAGNIASLTDDKFPKGYSRLGLTAARKIYLKLHDNPGFKYPKAVEEAGYIFAEQKPNTLLRELDYYGKLMPEKVVPQPSSGVPEEREYGKIGNPTVHIALNQLRKVVNALIKQYGHPTEIVVELSRDIKLPAKLRREADKQMSANQDRNDKIRKKLEENGVLENADNIEKYKLWEELASNPNDRRCVFTGNLIGIKALFSNEIEVEHILPRSRTLDDSLANKTLIYNVRRVNQLKHGQSPYEAFANSTEYPYEKIRERAQVLPANKRWRFEPDAMERFADENKFLARQLNDTRYISRVAKKYLEFICPKVGTVKSGRLTYQIRHQLGLHTILSTDGRKNRDDHRHHAVDAVAVAMSSVSLLQKLTRHYQLEELRKSGRSSNTKTDGAIEYTLKPSPDSLFKPWPEFRSQVEKLTREMVVSHRPDHGVQMRLFQETAYGSVSHKRQNEQDFNLVAKVNISKIGAKQISSRDARSGVIRDHKIQGELLQVIDGCDAKEISARIEQYAKNHKPYPIKSIRILSKSEPVERIEHVEGPVTHSKILLPQEVAYLEVWTEENSKIFKILPIYSSKASRKGSSRPSPHAKLFTRIFKGDILKLEDNSERIIAKVVSISPENKTLWLVRHFDGGNLSERYKNKELKYIFLSFSKFKEKKVRPIHVDPIGNVRDTLPDSLKKLYET
jgi:CRISPR-associated endonuclease Csn1